MSEDFTPLEELLPQNIPEVSPKDSPEKPRQRVPWDTKYNPRVDAAALALYPGAVMIAPDVYRAGEFLLDHNGMFLDPEMCPVCKTEPGGPDYRFWVAVNDNPKKPYEVTGWTFCVRCVSYEERIRIAHVIRPTRGRSKTPVRAGK